VRTEVGKHLTSFCTLEGIEKHIILDMLTKCTRAVLEVFRNKLAVFIAFPASVIVHFILRSSGRNILCYIRVIIYGLECIIALCEEPCKVSFITGVSYAAIIVVSSEGCPAVPLIIRISICDSVEQDSARTSVLDVSGVEECIAKNT